MIPNILTIAGSDPSGGAGIQADLKTFSALGCYGMAAITALTAQNTRGVSGVMEIPADFVRAQVDAVFQDIRVDAVKIGMVGSQAAIQALADLLQKHKPKHIILDPVMVAQSGDLLTSDESVAAMKEKLLPLASIVTPNMPEAKILLGTDYHDDLKISAQHFIQKLNVKSVLLKGGHGTGAESIDICAQANQIIELKAPRIETKNNHGTGCTLAAAIAAFLAHENTLEDAVSKAKNYITGALQHSKDINVGGGHGPVHHFHAVWKKP